MKSVKQEKLKEVNLGDVFTFKGADERYKAILCIQVDKTDSPFYYMFAALTFSREDKPIREDIVDGEFYGNTNKLYYPEYHSKEVVEYMWSVHPEVKPYYLCAYQLMMLRKEFIKCRDDLELITHLNVIFENVHVGCGAQRAADLKGLQAFFSSRLQKQIELYFTTPFKVRAFIKPGNPNC